MEKKATYLDEGNVGLAYMTDDHRVLKFFNPDGDAVDKKNFARELAFFATMKKLKDDPSDAHFFADYVVPAEQVVVSFKGLPKDAGLKQNALIKDFVDGQDVTEVKFNKTNLDVWDRLYKIYKVTYQHGYEFGDLIPRNILWLDGNPNKLVIVDAADYTSERSHVSFSKLCEDSRWKGYRYRNDTDKTDLDQPGLRPDAAIASVVIDHPAHILKSTPADSPDAQRSGETDAESKSNRAGGTTAPDAGKR